MQSPEFEPPPRSAWPVLAVGVVIGAAIGWVVFFGLPMLDQEHSPQVPQLPTPATTAPAAASTGFGLGAPAPGLKLLTPNGDSLQLDAQLGSVVVLNFWATWCGPCRTEMPLLQSAADQYVGDGLLVWGVNFDETAEQVQGFADELSIEFPLLLDPGGAVQERYRVRGYPTTAFVDREGKLAAYHIGVLTAEQLDSYLDQAGLFE